MKLRQLLLIRKSMFRARKSKTFSLWSLQEFAFAIKCRQSNTGRLTV